MTGIVRIKRAAGWLALFFVFFFTNGARADFTAGGWNLESGDSDPAYLAEQLVGWDEISLWGFSEVQNANVIKLMLNRLNSQFPYSKFKAVLGSTGRADRLSIVFDSKLFEKVDAEELHEANYSGRLRSPLAVRLRERASGKEFWFVVNHLYRGKKREERTRDKQARFLKQWMESRKIPVIAVGDYNFDCQVNNMGVCNNSFYELTKDQSVLWVQPQNPIRTQCNRRYNSILDFVFVNEKASEWVTSSSFILNAAYEFCNDDKKKSDHRPVGAHFVTQSQFTEIGGLCGKDCID